MGNLEHNLTEGSVIKNLILFSLPFVGSFVLQSLYSTVDLFIVSHYAGTYSISGLNGNDCSICWGWKRERNT